MATENRRHAANWATVLGLLALLPTPIVAQDHGPSPSDDHDSYGSYSPPMATVLVVIIGLFLTVGFLSIFFRHFAWFFGFDSGRRATAEGWRREAARGLDSSVLDSFPRFLYSDVKAHRIGKGTLECAVCLTEFSDDEVLQMLPVCSHVFHPNCIAPWLASHVTCPVCRANLEFHHRRNHDDSLIQQLQHQLSNDESEACDQNQTQQDNNHTHDAGVVTVQPSPSPIKTPVREIKDGGERRGKLPRSHSTGHSLVGDCERFKLRLPEEVRNKLVNANHHSMLPAMISPTIGYRSRTVGCSGFPVKPDRWRFSASPPFICRPGSAWSPKSDVDTESSHSNSTGRMSGPKSLLKSIKSPLNRLDRSSDIGERSSDRLCPIRQPQDLESEGRYTHVFPPYKIKKNIASRRRLWGRL
ncbi:hypothetical protein Cgig2_025969 [Carnegiea gigantea]|uniref:RING-type E3 ubiquitin transferase n=1 Tax=Carnegiea gigantea TaxID=171969 RepID=A0A9Q1JZN7_9CARY|nr:hypothetical protein Cgig2_025969 [Carnegiea gigantea]